MLIPFLTRSRFLPALEAELEARGGCPKPGRPLTVEFGGGGYNRTVELEISYDSPDGFEADITLSDPTRFPVRIRAAATALRDRRCWGRYVITHESGALTILRLGAAQPPTRTEDGQKRHSTGRIEDIRRFYGLLRDLETTIGGRRLLSECSGRMQWPERGVYFFLEHGEVRSDSGAGMRIVRVGTHAVSEGSTTTLWKRLSQHRGTLSDGGGNHRGSIFRQLVGNALARRDGIRLESWGRGRSTYADTARLEREHERRVSAYIGAMPFVWVDVDDQPGRDSMRARIERNSIALLSNYGASIRLDPPSSGWLGNHSDREPVIKSGLWNQNHVRETYDAAFLNDLERVITLMGRRA